MRYGLWLVMTSIVSWTQLSQLNLTTATEVPSAPFSAPSVQDSSDCANGQCNLANRVASVPKVAAEKLRVVVDSQPVRSSVRYVQRNQPVRSMLRRLIGR